jgi:putative colanic acid biosynthesis acetyltransferase WcaF
MLPNESHDPVSLASAAKKKDGRLEMNGLSVLGRLGWRSKAVRLVWSIVYLILFRPSPVLLHGYRVLLLRCFGAQIRSPFYVYPSVRIWAPWNLYADEGSCLGPSVDCYNVVPIRLGRNALVSQYSYLCTASHDHRVVGFPLIAGEICLESDCWIAAKSFVGPGVTVGAGSVVGAQSVVVKCVTPNTVVAGSPARVISEVGRVISS